MVDSVLVVVVVVMVVLLVVATHLYWQVVMQSAARQVRAHMRVPQAQAGRRVVCAGVRLPACPHRRRRAVLVVALVLAACLPYLAYLVALLWPPPSYPWHPTTHSLPQGAAAHWEFVHARVPVLGGRQVRRLKHLQTLGRGGFGEVTLVVHEGRWAVRKTLLAPGSLAELLWEARVLLELAGAGGAPRLLAVCQEPPTLLMEYVGRTLLRFLGQGCTAAALLDTLAAITRRLGEVHARGILHRDLKMDNITVTSTTASSTPSFHIIDFGRACRVGHLGEHLCSPHAFHFLPWVAPEVKAGGRRLLPSADVFSVGHLVRRAVHLANHTFLTAPLQVLADACTCRRQEERPSLAQVYRRLAHLKASLTPSKARQPLCFLAPHSPHSHHSPPAGS